MPQVYIVTGSIRTGKTTALSVWAKSNTCGGVLSPDREEGRVFLDLMSGKEVNMEAQTPADDDLLIGRFRFRKAAFEFANAALMQAIQDKRDVIIVDEVGPLELKGLGLDSAVRRILKDNIKSRLVLVVREGLVDKVISHYALADVVLITKDDLNILEEG